MTLDLDLGTDPITDSALAQAVQVVDRDVTPGAISWPILHEIVSRRGELEVGRILPIDDATLSDLDALDVALTRLKNDFFHALGAARHEIDLRRVSLRGVAGAAA